MLSEIRSHKMHSHSKIGITTSKNRGDMHWTRRWPEAVVLKLSDKWLSKYGLLENFNTKIISFGYVLDFDL